MFRNVSLFCASLACVALAGCGAGSSTASVGTSLGARSIAAIKPPPFLPGPLNGYSTPRARALRRPLAIVIENYAPDSRPQSGLSQASMVIETLAEGGVTRFLAIYLENDAAKVGPVRSTRMYFDRWAAGFHAILAHVGGNDDALAWLWHLPNVFNIDENRWEKSLYDTGTPLFWRSADRAAPHNMYVSTYGLRAYAAKNKQDWTYSGASFPHNPAAPLKQRGHRTTIDITYLNPLGPIDNPAYDVRYQYNRATNTYARFMGGTPHVDVLNNRQINPSNVVIMRTAPAVADPYAGPTPESILINNRGTGPATFFRDGRVISGHWQQVNDNAMLHFFDARWRPIQLNQGQTWVEVVPQGSNVTWSAA